MYRGCIFIFRTLFLFLFKQSAYTKLNHIQQHTTMKQENDD